MKYLKKNVGTEIKKKLEERQPLRLKNMTYIFLKQKDMVENWILAANENQMIAQ